MGGIERYKAADVFVAGSAPDVTYYPRDERHLERRLTEYLAQHGKALCVFGPTKSGKTVLVERLLPRDQAVWLEGSDLTSADAFWELLNSGLSLPHDVQTKEGSSSGRSGALGGSGGLGSIFSATAKVERTESRDNEVSTTRTSFPADSVRRYLERNPVTIVIDDFHHAPSDVQLRLARAVKGLIRATSVVMIAIPHEAFAVVRAEPEMDGRVWNLPVATWTDEELGHIARAGFSALGIDDSGEVIGNKLASSSYGAPFLMQQLCSDYALSIEVSETSVPQVPAREPTRWDAFFGETADRFVPGSFEALLEGPRTRARERQLVTKNGRPIDVYNAVLLAIAAAHPRMEVKTSEVRRNLDAIVRHVPQSQRIESVLKSLSRIADERRGLGDPALAYKDGVLHIVDPFLLFYLRYGSWKGGYDVGVSLSRRDEVSAP
jgi:hypothetical protein